MDQTVQSHQAAYGPQNETTCARNSIRIWYITWGLDKWIVLEAGVGGGKTTGQIIPNIYSLNHASLVITDTSGDLFKETSGYLKRKGYRLKVLNLRDVTRSHAFNPLADANSYSEIAQLAHLLIRSSPAIGNKDDPFWSAGAEKIVRIIIQCMKNRNEPQLCTLPQLKTHLARCATASGPDHPFSRWIMESSLDDPASWQDYLAFISGNEKTINSMISTADVALMAVANPDLVGLTSVQEFNFADLQKRKTALYVLCRQQDMSHYAFLLSAFFTQLFNTLLTNPDPKHIPVYALLDEFGQIIVPNFATIASTARKYKVALFLCLQSAMQLELRYSRSEAHTILDSLRTQIYLSGTNLEAAERISRRLGKKRPKSQKDRVAYMDGNLMNPDEIINMRNNEAILLHGNQRAHRYRVLPYFKNGRFQRYSRIRPIDLPRTPKIPPEIT